MERGSTTRGASASAGGSTSPESPGISAASAPPTSGDLRSGRGSLPTTGALVLLAVLGGLVAVNLPELGSDPWPFRPPGVEPVGPLAALVHLSGGQWSTGLLRAAAAVAGLLVAGAAAFALSGLRLRRAVAVVLAVAVAALLVLPGVLLQAGLRQATAPWFNDNDSTYQIEIAGDMIRHGKTPYGADYTHTGLERFYSLDGSVAPGTRQAQVALRHLAYFPGTPLTAAAWGLLPRPFDDYRFLVALATLALLPAALLFPGPLGARLALGAVLAANPLAVRAAWFGTADAPALLALVLAFGLLARRRLVWAAGLLGAAVLLKQFAVVAVPFFAATVVRRVPRAALLRPALAFVAVVAAGFLPFLVAGPGALVADTITYGGATYRIIGYGLAGILLELHVVHGRFGAYPFAWLALLVWLPLTALLVWRQLRSPVAWTALAGFGVSIFVLVFLGRVFQTSYLVWPLSASAVAGLLALGVRPAPAGRAEDDVDSAALRAGVAHEHADLLRDA